MLHRCYYFGLLCLGWGDCCGLLLIGRVRFACVEGLLYCLGLGGDTGFVALVDVGLMVVWLACLDGLGC